MRVSAPIWKCGASLTLVLVMSIFTMCCQRNALLFLVHDAGFFILDTRGCRICEGKRAFTGYKTDFENATDETITTQNHVNHTKKYQF